MSWVKIDDAFFRSRRGIAAGKDGRSLFVAGVCFCASRLTNGRIGKDEVRVVCADAEVSTKVVDKLVGIGWWFDHGDHYEVDEYLIYNPTREKVLADREAAKKRMSRRREAELPEQFAECSPEHHTEQLANVGRGSLSPVPVPLDTSKPSPSNGVLHAEFERWWKNYPRRIAKQEAEKAYVKARKQASVDVLTAGLEQSKAQWASEQRAQDKIPHAATWLNQGRWEDESSVAPDVEAQREYDRWATQ